MMTLSSFAIWIEIGLAATFTILLISLILGFVVKANSKSSNSWSQPGARTGGWMRFFRRNQRRMDRIPCNLTLEMRDRTETVRMGTGQVLNLSNSGACMSSRVMLTLGERIQGQMNALNNEIIKISGLIVWKRMGRHDTFYGIRFR